MADTPHRKFYALIADPNARPTYPPSFEDPQEPVTPIGGGDGAETFLELTDTPSTYTGQGTKKVVVKSDETGLEFITDSAGGDFVSYDIPDGKNATEQQQARTNIGSSASEPQIVTTTGVINPLTRTSNCIFFTGAGAVDLRSMDAGISGEQVVIMNLTGSTMLIGESISDSESIKPNNRGIPDGQFVVLVYGSGRWQLLNTGVYVSGTGINDYPMQVFMQNGTDPIFEVRSNRVTYVYGNGGGANIGVLNLFAGVANAQLIIGTNSVGTVIFRVRGSGAVELGARSSGAVDASRRDELPFNYPQTVVTTGIINNLSLSNEGIKLLILTLADELTGVLPVTTTTGRLLRIECRNAAGIIIRHESASSTAANRFVLPGAVDLTIANGEVYTFIYTNGRWRRSL